MDAPQYFLSSRSRTQHQFLVVGVLFLNFSYDCARTPPRRILEIIQYLSIISFDI